MPTNFGALVTAALAQKQGPDVSRSDEILIPEILLFSLATMAIVARLYVRLRIKPKLWLDDWTMFAAYAWTIFGIVTITLQVHYGVGRHAVYIGEQNVVQALKWNQFARMTFIPAMALVKMSICFFMLRILDSRTHPHFRIYIWLVMAASLLSNIVLFVTWAIQCIPLDAVWDPNIQGSCMSPTVVVDVAYVQAGFNLVTDILCALFPMFFFNSAYMRWRTRSALITLVLLGILTSVTAVLRVVYLPDLEVENDATWALTNVTIVGLIESKSSIFLTCLPAIKCLWPKFLEHLPCALARRRQFSKNWDRMESPILPFAESSTSVHRRTPDILPLRPLSVSRERGSAKGYDEPPATPGFDEPIVKVTSWI